MKYLEKITFGVLFLAMMVFLGLQVNTHIKLTHAATGAEVRSTNTQNPYSTTTRAYIGSGGSATTTLSMYTEQIDQIDFNFLLKSTSTAPSAKWRYEYSENNVDWFSDDIPQNQAATTSTQWVSSTFNEYSWGYASSTGGTSNSQSNFKHTQLKFLNSRYTRIVFYLAPGSGAADVWIQARLKAINPI